MLPLVASCGQGAVSVVALEVITSFAMAGWTLVDDVALEGDALLAASSETVVCKICLSRVTPAS